MQLIGSLIGWMEHKYDYDVTSESLQSIVSLRQKIILQPDPDEPTTHGPKSFGGGDGFD